MLRALTEFGQRAESLLAGCLPVLSDQSAMGLGLFCRLLLLPRDTAPRSVGLADNSAPANR